MLVRLFRLFALSFVLALLIGGVQAQPLPLPGGTPVHRLILNTDSSGQMTVTGYSTAFVRAALTSDPITRFVAAVAAVQDTELDIATVQLMDNATGAVVYQSTVTIPRWVRGEFAADPNNLSVGSADGSNIQGTRIPWENRTFSVNVPVIAGADRLAVSLVSSGRSSSVIDLAETAAAFSTRGPRDVTLIPLDGYDNGDPANRLDIVILGDGYTAAQQAVFEADAQALADGLFGFAPFSTYAGYFNAVGVFSASNESGADQPASCPDTSIPMNGQFKDTRYDSTYCYSGIARLLVATDTTAIYDDATAGYADWDEIFVIVNDPLYGGSGGAVAVVSKTSFNVEMLQHEVGHSLIRLDDEYNTATPGYPPCSDYGRSGITTPCRPNVTDQTSRSLIKWSRWISPSTPIPTTTAQGSEVVGLWLGAHYQPDTYYRPCYNCTMKSLGQPFGPVASEQLPMVLYGGGWEGQGSYWDELGSGSGIDIIEPGTTTPDPLAGSIHIPATESQTFAFTVLSPGAGDNTRVKWTVNDTLMQDSKYANQEVSYFTFTPISPGPFSIVASATDTGGILHSTQAHASKSTRTWTVTADGYTGSGTEMITNGGFETRVSPTSKQPASWTLINTTGSKLMCNADPIFYAFEGECAYRMKGVSGLTASLKQNAIVLGDAGDAFSLSSQFDTVNLTAAFSVIVKFTLSNGTIETLKLQQLARDQAMSEPYFRREAVLILGLDSASVTKVKVQVKFPGTGGKVYIDALSLQHYDEYLTSPPPPGGRLSLPEAFRGSN